MLPHAGQFAASEKHLRSQLLNVNPHLELVFWVLLGHSSAELGAGGVLLTGLRCLKPKREGSRVAFWWSGSVH